MSTRKVHLIAICGSGMGAFAGLLKAAGYQVAGSDVNVYPPMSTQLMEWGIPVFQGHSADNLAYGPDLVVIGNFCRKDNPECVAVQNLGIPYMSMPQAMASLFLSSRHSVVVTGTHGKTTSSALITHILRVAGKDPSAFIGGIVPEFEGPFLLGQGKHFVVEGDEYDTAYFDKGPKFLHYRPQTALLTSIEYDHADIYPDMNAYEEAFHRFVGLLPPSGTLAACWDEPTVRRIASGTKSDLQTYGLSMDAMVRAVELESVDGGTEFTLVIDGVEVDGRFQMALAGEHNLRNGLGAIAVCRSLGVDWASIREGLSSFHGVAKRQQVMGEVNNILVVDDFANHPTAVRETIRAMRQRYPGRRLWSLFEAKSNSSRRNVFQEQYGDALMMSDQVVVARPFIKQDVIPVEKRLNVDELVAHINNGGQSQASLIPEVDDIVSYVAGNALPNDVILIMSGSGFGGIQQKLIGALKERHSIPSK